MVQLRVAVFDQIGDAGETGVVQGQGPEKLLFFGRQFRVGEYLPVQGLFPAIFGNLAPGLSGQSGDDLLFGAAAPELDKGCFHRVVVLSLWISCTSVYSRERSDCVPDRREGQEQFAAACGHKLTSCNPSPCKARDSGGRSVSPIQCGYLFIRFELLSG